MENVEGRNAKNAWAKEHQGLKIKCRMLNRTKYQSILSIRPDGKRIVGQLEKLENLYVKDQEEEANQIYHKISLLRKNTRELKDLLRTTPTIADDRKLVTLQHKTTEIETGLKDFKLESRNRYEELQKEEAMLEKEIAMYSEKFEAISKATKEVKQQNAKPRQPLHIKKVPEKENEAQEEEEEINMVKAKLEKVENDLHETIGVYCGWDRSDHADFLKIVAKCKGSLKTPAFISDIQKLVPDRSATDIEEHIEKYEAYEKIINERKQLLARYKELKKTNVKKETEDQDGEKENIEKQNKPKAPKVDYQKQKQKLEEWKKKKQEEQMKVNEKKIEAEREKEKENQKKIEREKIKKQQLLKEYKEKKALEEMRQKEEEIRQKEKNKKDVKPEDVVKLLEREQTTFLKRQEKLQKKKMKQFEKQEKSERVKQKFEENFKHVSSKLNSETTALKSKKREKFNADSMKRDALTFGGDVLRTQIRAIPSWRVGL